MDDRLRPTRCSSSAASLVSRKGQAQRLTAAFTKSPRKTPYVTGLGWFTLMDQTSSEGGEAGWGLLDADGVPKPAFAAYKALP